MDAETYCGIRGSLDDDADGPTQVEVEEDVERRSYAENNLEIGESGGRADLVRVLKDAGKYECGSDGMYGSYIDAGCEEENDEEEDENVSGIELGDELEVCRCREEEEEEDKTDEELEFDIATDDDNGDEDDIDADDKPSSRSLLRKIENM